MNIQVTEYKPSYPLSSYVHSFWTGVFNVSRDKNFSQLVVPNGYIELIIHLTEDHCALTKNNKQWDNSPDHTLIGLYTQPYEVKFSNLVNTFGIRFFPEGIYNLFKVPPAKIIGTYEDSEDVFGKPFREFCDRIKDKNNTTNLIAYAEQVLLRKLEENQNDHDYIKKAATIIRNHQGMLTQSELMSKVPISERQLQREFKNRIGITAKKYMRIARMNAIQKYMQQADSFDFSFLTYEYGFADQSHFIREFKRLTGNSPRSFRNKENDYIINP